MTGTTLIYNVGIRLIGVYVLIKGLPAFINWFFRFGTYAKISSKVPPLIWGQLAETIALLILALHLLAGGSLIITEWLLAMSEFTKLLIATVHVTTPAEQTSQTVHGFLA